MTVPQDGSPSLDRRLLMRIYSIEQPVFTSAVVLADRSAYPVFYASVPSIWAGALLFGGRDDTIAAAKLSGAWIAASGSSLLLKHLFKRERPFRTEEGVNARTEYVGGRVIDRFSFPSGHATLASAIVTSAMLAYPRWYVIAPASIWVGTVSVSRIWMGVHYPSDVAVGLVLGTATGIVSHLVLNGLID